MSTRQLDGVREDTLTPFAGIWCVPGSPYERMDGALAAIRVAREQGIPFLGTCGGFQPELSASTGQPHPLIQAFLAAASARADR